MPPRDTTSEGRSRRDPKPKLAQDFVDIVAQGGTLREAHEVTGLGANDSLVKAKLERLAIYAPLVRNEETRDTIANAVLMEEALSDANEPRDRITAAGKLQKKSDGPLIEINLSEEIMKLKPGKLFEDEREG